IDTNRIERAQIELLEIGRRWLDDHLILVIVLKPIRVFPVAAILGAARWLDIGGSPWPGADGAQGRCRVERPGPHFHVIGLEDDAAPFGPILVERQDQILERFCRIESHYPPRLDLRGANYCQPTRGSRKTEDVRLPDNKRRFGGPGAAG